MDDFCFAGSEIFQAKVIERLCHLFKIKFEEVSEFQYIGLSIKESKDNIKIGQNENVKKLKCIPIEGSRNLREAISTTEVTGTR